jgi:hypothetical protein
MAFLPPIEMPVEMGFNQREFDIARLQQVSPGGAGFIQTIERAMPAWYAAFSTPPLRDDRYDEVRAFLDLLEGSMNTFLCWDPRRAMPRAYQNLPTTANPWSASGQNVRMLNADYANSRVSFDRMAPGAIITAGDYFSVLYQNCWYLFRSTATVVADSSGFALVPCKPRPDIKGSVGGAINTDLRYRRACFEAKIIGGIKEDDSVESYPRISFKAFQFYNRTGP